MSVLPLVDDARRVNGAKTGNMACDPIAISIAIAMMVFRFTDVELSGVAIGLQLSLDALFPFFLGYHALLLQEVAQIRINPGLWL